MWQTCKESGTVTTEGSLRGNSDTFTFNYIIMTMGYQWLKENSKVEFTLGNNEEML